MLAKKSLKKRSFLRTKFRAKKLVAVLILSYAFIFQRKRNSKPELKTDVVDKVKLRLFFDKLKSMLKGDWGSSNERAFCNLILKTADWPLCGDGIRISESIIYSFGIADDYDFEAQAGKFGFQVKAFDPTRYYPKELADNVTFFNWGLRGDMVKEWSHPVYGDTVGELLTFPEILERCAHDSNNNIIIKIDCEGCEWESLSLLHKFPDILEKIQQINVEFHFTTTLRVNSSSDLLHIESVHDILADQGFLPWYIFPQGGSRSDRVHLDIIRELGFPNNLCCFEIGFLRKPTQVLSRPNISPHQIKLHRPESLWKWGQIWGNDGIEYINHEMLSKSASLTKIKRASLRKEIISQNSHEPLYSSMNEANGYLIPFIRGQGLNNQLWEYRSAAIIAKATNRTLCLEPFHRFYLQKSGRKFIPFEDLFDKESLKSFVHVASSEECAQKCDKIIHRHLELISKEALKFVKKKNIVDWRPGSHKLFYESTGFQYLPFTEFINVNITDQGVSFNSLKDITKVLSPYAIDQCISILGTTPTISGEFLEWSRVLKVNQNIKKAVKQIKKEIFNDESYISIHWRFEESKCNGIGRGIGFGRSISIHRSKFAPISNRELQVRKSDDHADLCFFAGPLPSKLAMKGVWLRLVSKTAVLKWIKGIMKERNIDNIYIATDCSDHALLQWIKFKTGAITKSNIEPILTRFVSPEENDIISRIEQQICTESSVFLGTSMSSWTSSVIEERFKNRNSFFIQDKYNITRRPDPMNHTLYFDIEVCNCEWEL